MPEPGGAGGGMVEIEQHPAVQRWLSLGEQRGMPAQVTTLGSGARRHTKSAAYRLVGAGPRGEDVVAKCCRGMGARFECTLYQQVLAHLPMPSLACYGWAPEPGADCSWLFLEEACGEVYTPLEAEHRATLGEWLGRLHALGGAAAAGAKLPERGCRQFLDHLHSGTGRVRRARAAAGLPPGTAELLGRLLGLLEQTERAWGGVEEACAGAPPALTHGDLVRKNVRLRSSASGPAPLVFDWEMAGWGIPAADLARTPPGSENLAANVDLAAYTRGVRESWPDLRPGDIERQARAGTLLRLLAAVDWASTEIEYTTTGRAMAQIEVYAAWLAGALADLGRATTRQGRGGALR